MKRAIPYYRVSTERQGRSGLGLQAQKDSVLEFVRCNNLQLLDEHIEVESGNNSKRPILLDALRNCKGQNAVLLIAKLDRLGRNVAFISMLMESKVEFIAVDNPSATKLVVHIMAAFAEHERDQISIRTREALKAAKQRGVELGIYGKTVLAKKNKDDANRFAINLAPLIADFRRKGLSSVRKITDELNRLNVPTYRGPGFQWHPASVQNIIARIRSRDLPIK